MERESKAMVTLAAALSSYLDPLAAALELRPLKPFLSCYEGSLVVRVILQVSELDRRRPLQFSNFLRENTSFFKSKVSNPLLFLRENGFQTIIVIKWPDLHLYLHKWLQ